MSSFPMEVGRVVFSKAGRDAGHYFVVVAVLDKDHVAIANGCQRCLLYTSDAADE